MSTSSKTINKSAPKPPTHSFLSKKMPYKIIISPCTSKSPDKNTTKVAQSESFLNIPQFPACDQQNSPKYDEKKRVLTSN